MPISRQKYSKKALALMRYDVQFKRSNSKNTIHSIFIRKKSEADILVKDLKKQNRDESNPLKHYDISISKIKK